MSQKFQEGRLQFLFPDAWQICRPEGCSFYSRHFSNFAGGNKEVDFAAYDPAGNTLWLIEVKDYQTNFRTKEIGLAEEVALKVRDVLALLPAAGIRDQTASGAGGRQVGEFFRTARRATQLRVVLHCELPTSPSKLFPGLKDAANLQTKLSQQVRCIDPHPLFTNPGLRHVLPWTVLSA